MQWNSKCVVRLRHGQSSKNLRPCNVTKREFMHDLHDPNNSWAFMDGYVSRSGPGYRTLETSSSLLPRGFLHLGWRRVKTRIKNHPKQAKVMNLNDRSNSKENWMWNILKLAEKPKTFMLDKSRKARTILEASAVLSAYFNDTPRMHWNRLLCFQINIVKNSSKKR